MRTPPVPVLIGKVQDRNLNPLIQIRDPRRLNSRIANTLHEIPGSQSANQRSKSKSKPTARVRAGASTTPEKAGRRPFGGAARSSAARTRGEALQHIQRNPLP